MGTILGEVSSASVVQTIPRPRLRREDSANLRNEAEQRLRESQEIFRQLAENIREVFWMSDPEKTRMIYISPAYETIWGRTCQSLYAAPRNWIEAIHPEDRRRVLEAALTKQASGQYNETYRIVHSDGSIRWIQDRAFPIRDNEGKVYRIAGIAEDVTARKAGEQQLTTLLHALQSTSELVCITDLEDRFTFVNQAFLKAYGYTETEILGKTHGILYSSKNPPSLLTEILKQTRAGGWRGEVMDARKDGSEFPVSLTTSQIKDLTGQVIGLLAVARDITERKRADEALRESERRLRLIAENTSDVIFAFDMERRPVYVNPAVKELTGYTFSEIREKQFINWVHPEDQPRMLQVWEDLFAGKTFSEVEFRLLTKTGQMKWCSSSWGPLLDEAGRQIGVQGRERDITVHKELEGEILEISSNERRTIGHELHDGLCQYLAGIAFRAKALEETLLAEGSLQAREAREITTFISNAISQTRSLARGLDPIEVETIGLPAALQNLAAETTKFFNVTCLFRGSESALPIDPQTSLALYRIVQEAIHNATTHGCAGRIEISLVLDDSQLRLSIQDDGAGFDVQAASSAGMGLRVMQYRACSVGANLTISSQLTQGTEIRCLVPCAPANL